jgi:hypothetical protein
LLLLWWWTSSWLRVVVEAGLDWVLEEAKVAAEVVVRVAIEQAPGLLETILVPNLLRLWLLEPLIQ